MDAIHIQLFLCTYQIAYSDQNLEFHPVLSFFPFFSLPDVLWDFNDPIWRKGAPFVAMTGHTAVSSDILLVEGF